MRSDCFLAVGGLALLVMAGTGHAQQKKPQGGIYWAATAEAIAAGTELCKHFDTPSLEEQRNKLLQKYGNELVDAEISPQKKSGRVFSAHRYDSVNNENIDYFYFDNIKACELHQAALLKNKSREASPAADEDKTSSDPILSIAARLKKADKEHQHKEQEQENNRNLIMAAKAKLEKDYRKYAWEVFNDLKKQGIHFNDVVMPKDSSCENQRIDSRSGGEFIVYRTGCTDTITVTFEVRNGNKASLSALVNTKEQAIDEIDFNKNCEIILNSYTYSCPKLMKPEMSATIRKNVRESIAKDLAN